MDYVTLEGGPYEIGQRKAEFDGDYLAQVLESCFDRTPNPRFEQWLLEEAIPYSESQWPDLAEEIRGYREASGCDELMIYKYYYSQVRPRFACSNLAVRTEDAGCVFAKNTDLNHFEFPWIVFCHYKPDRGREFFGYTYRAQVTVQGMNSAGLCSGGTSMSGMLERAPSVPAVGCPASFVHRKNMQYAGTVEEAEANLRQHPMFAKGAGLFYLDATGACKHINRNSTVFHVRDHTRLPAFCVGFFDMDSYEYRQEYQPIVEGSRARLAYAEAFFGARGSARLQDVVDFLRSHGPDWSRPGQWCRHHPADRHLRTVVSHICIPSQRRVLYCHGYPCETPYEEFVFPG